MPVTQSQPRKWDIKFQESLPTHSATVVSASGDNSAQKRTDNRRPVVTEPLTVGTRGAASCTAPPWAGGSSLTPASALGPLPGRAFPSRGRGEAPAVGLPVAGDCVPLRQPLDLSVLVSSIETRGASRSAWSLACCQASGSDNWRLLSLTTA